MNASVSPSDDSILFWAGSLAKNWMVAIRMQTDRLRNHDGHSWSIDVYFLGVALTRVRHAAILATRVRSVHTEITRAIEEFDQALPSLKELRDAGEHADDYVLGQGRNKRVSHRWLLSGAWIGAVYSWSDMQGRELSLDIIDAERAALDLSRRVRALHSETRP